MPLTLTCLDRNRVGSVGPVEMNSWSSTPRPTRRLPATPIMTITDLPRLLGLLVGVTESVLVIRRVRPWSVGGRPALRPRLRRDGAGTTLRRTNEKLSTSGSPSRHRLCLPTDPAESARSLSALPATVTWPAGGDRLLD
jgi:hypothetical protein